MTTFSRETTGAEVVEACKEHIASKTVVITGASAGGIGAQTASDIAKAQPAHLVLLARDAFKVQPVIDQITSISPSTKVGVVPVNLDDLDSVRAAATAVSKHLGEEGKIDVLINNAGIMGVKYAKTKIGIESQFATNHLGHFMLTQRLFCLLRLGGGARVVNLSSNGYLVCPFRPDDVNFDDGKAYDPLSGYGQSKTANILFTKGLAKRGVTSFALHPGLIFGTHLGDKMDLSLFATINEVAKKNTGKEFGSLDKPKSIEQGSATSITAAFDPTLASASGGYLKDCQLVEVEEYASDDMMVEKLWSLSETLAGEKFVI